jgi:hypothetical protein
MVEVAIGYGGAQAEAVAKKLSAFLKEEDLDTFLASPQSHDIPHGATDEEQRRIIKKKFLECNIIVYVCHDGTANRPVVVEETRFMKKNKLFTRTIVFSKNDDCIPEKLREIWHPLHFTPEKPEESFNRLLNEIFRQHIRLSTPIQASPASGGV